jgi:hypothetical protein
MMNKALLTPVIPMHAEWTPFFLVAACLCLVGAIAPLMVDPDRKLETEGQLFSNA